MESAVDSPAIALFNTPGTHRASVGPRHVVSRILHNIRHGNIALLVVFCGCLVIFVRALFGAGYDEGHSAHADAASSQHPSLLGRWTHQHHAVQAEWDKVHAQQKREEPSSGLWAKIRKEDQGAHTASASNVPGADALHWLRVMEDKALAGLGRKPRHDAVVAPALALDDTLQVPIAVPEHDIHEDLDAHDAGDDDEYTKAKHAAPPPAAAAAAAPVAPDAHVPAPVRAAQKVPPADAADQPEPSSLSPPSEPAAEQPGQTAPDAAEAAPEHKHNPSELEDPDDEPVYAAQGK